MSLAGQLIKSGAANLEPRQVWRVRDDLIVIPEQRAGEPRTKHHNRYVLILSNDWICAALDCKLVTVAPFSSLIKFFSKAEIQINKSDTNGLEMDSRLMLGHIQPLLKNDLKEYGSVQESGEVANWRGFERFGPGGWLLRLASLAASPNLLAMSEGKWCGSGGERGVYPRGA